MIYYHKIARVRLHPILTARFLENAFFTLFQKLMELQRAPVHNRGGRNANYVRE